jgi:hypothetical protein
MTTPEGDDLLQVIRTYVHGRVHPSSEEVVVEIVAQVLVTMMSEPRFYNHLKVVIDLQRRVASLETAIRHYQSKAARPSPGARPPAAKKAVKKMPAKKAAVRKVSKKPPPMNVKQFRRGAQGL